MIQRANGRKARTERECPSAEIVRSRTSSRSPRNLTISATVIATPERDRFFSPLPSMKRTGPLNDSMARFDDYLDFGNSPLRDAYSST